MINADDFYGRDAFAKLADNLRQPRPKDGIPQSLKKEHIMARKARRAKK